MVRFQTQGPGVALQMPDWNAEYKRQTPFKQIVGLYNMWQSLSPDTRNWLASLFKGDEPSNEELPIRDEILDTTVNPGAGTLERFGDNDWREVGNIQYIDDKRPAKYSSYKPGTTELRGNITPLDIQVDETVDPYGIGEIDPWNIELKPTKVRGHKYPAMNLTVKDTVGDPSEFLQPQDSTSYDLPAGHYDNAWRGLL